MTDPAAPPPVYQYPTMPPPMWGPYGVPMPAPAPPPPPPASGSEAPPKKTIHLPQAFEHTGPVVSQNVRIWTNVEVTKFIQERLGPEYRRDGEFNTLCDYNGMNLLNLGLKDNREMFNLHKFSKETHPALLLEGISLLMLQQKQYEEDQAKEQKKEEDDKKEAERKKEAELKEQAAKEIEDAPIRELVQKLANFRAAYPTEADWRKTDPKMEIWQPMHVYEWLSRHKETEVSRFADAVGRLQLSGQALVDLVQYEDAACKNAALLKCGEEYAIRVFCAKIKVEKGMIDLNQKKEKDDGIPVIARNDIKMNTRILRKGGYGVIYQGKYQNQEVAVKTLLSREPAKPKEEAKEGAKDVRAAPKREEQKNSNDSETAREIEREARMMYASRGPNVVPLIGVNKADKEPFLVTEFMPCGSVEDEYQNSRRGDPTSIFHRNNPQNVDANKQPRPPLIQKVRIVSRVAFAISSFHNLPRPIVHLDIAARNVLLDRKKQPKVCDFGLAAFQDDMIKIHQLRKALLDSGVPWSQVLLRERSIINEKASDPNFALYQLVQKHANPNPRWTPPTAYGENPLFDWKMDVYAFGCFMYELATEGIPHEDLQHGEEILERKKAPGAPHCDLNPTNVDPEYDSIMLLCLSVDPPKMDSIAAMLDKLYMKLRRGNYADHETDIQKLFHGVRIVPEDREPQRRQTVAQNPDDNKNMVTFNFPKNICFEAKYSDLQSRWETFGETQENLQRDIKIALLSWDYESITKLMQCVLVENSKPNVTVLVDCLEALGTVAEAADGPTDEHWEGIARAVLMLLETVDKCGSQEGDEPLSEEHYRAIATAGLYAFSRLGENRGDLASAPMPSTTKDELLAPPQPPIHGMALNIVSNIIRRDLFEGDPKFQEHICDAIRTLSSSSMGTYSKAVARESMYQKGLVVALLEILYQQQQLGNVGVITTAVKALLCFQTRQLLSPNPPSVVSGNFHFARRLSQVSPSSSTSVDSNPDDAHPTVFATLVTFLRNFGGRVLSEPPPPSPIGPPPLPALACLEASTIPAHISLLETVGKALFDICQEDQEQVGQFVSEMTKESVRFLLTLIQTYKESFAIQEGVMGLLRYAVIAEAEEAGSVDRIGYIAEFDPAFSLFVQAMNMFPRDKNVVVTVGPTASNFKPSWNTQFSRTTYTMTSANSQSRQQNQVVGDLGKLLLEGFKSWLGELQQGDIDRQHSAARLQLSASIILGTACSVFDKAQQALVSSHCCLHIVTALRTFRADVSLVTFGCESLSHICRKNTTHQNVLAQFGIFAVLSECLEMHQTEWRVSDGVLMVLIGLLEPSPEILEKLEGPGKEPVVLIEDEDDEEVDDFSGSSAEKARKIKEAQAAAKQKLKEKRELERKSQPGAKLAAWLLESKLWVRLVEQCMYKSTLPWCSSLAANFLKLVGALLFWLPNKLKDWSIEFVPWSGEMLLTSMFVRGLGKLLTVAPGEVYTPDDRHPSLTEYVLSALMEWHRLPREANSYAKKVEQKSVSPVHAGGLAILVALLTKDAPDDYCIGDTLKLSANNSDQILGLAISAFSAAITLPTQPAPILLRYALWLMILVLNDPRWNQAHSAANMSVDAIILTEGVTLSLLMDLIQTYHTYRSLQTLCIILVTKLYELNHFTTIFHEAARLRQLVLATREAAATSDWTADEGHDTVTMGYWKPFPQLGQQCTHLLKILDKFFDTSEQKVELVVEPVWDGRIRPHRIEFTAALATGDGTDFHLKVFWDKKKTVSWTLTHTYPEFVELNDYMSNIFGFNIPFPPKSLFGLNDAALEKRKLGLQNFVNELLKHPFVCHNERFMNFFKITAQSKLKCCCIPPKLRNFVSPSFDGAGMDVLVVEEHRLLFCAYAKPEKKSRIGGVISIYRDDQLVFAQHSEVGIGKLTWNATRRCLCALRTDGSVKFYMLAKHTLREESEVLQKLIKAPVTTVVHSSRGNYMFLATADSKALVLDTSTYSPVASTHVGKVIVISAAFEDKEDLLFMGTNTCELRVCCMKNDQPLTAPLCAMKLRLTGQINAMCFVPELEALLMVIDDDLVVLSLTETEVPLATRSIKSKIMRSKQDLPSLVSATFSLKQYLFGPEQRASSMVFITTESPYPVYFIAVACFNGRVDLFQVPRSAIGVNSTTSAVGTATSSKREFELVASWKFKPQANCKLSYSPSKRTLYCCAQESNFAITLASFVPPTISELQAAVPTSHGPSLTLTGAFPPIL